MKVCIVGSGSQGTGLAGLLAMEEDVEVILLADYSSEALGRAKSLVEALGDKLLVREIQTARLDASDVEAVREAISGYDVVFNATIPRFNVPIMRACVAEGCHYLDLFASPFAGDGVPYDETIDAQFDLDADFDAAGVLALPSIGMSPGWTSFASQALIETFDAVQDVIVRWADYVDTDVLFAPISPVTVFSEWFGAPGPLNNHRGEPEVVSLLESEESFEFPDPIGKRAVFTVTAHPDIVLIPRFAGTEIENCMEKGGIFLGKRSTKDMWVEAIQAATAKQGSAREECNLMEKFAAEMHDPSEYGKLLEQGLISDHAVCFSVEVNGYVDGEFVRKASYYTSTLEESRKHLAWSSPAVYGTVGGLPIELVLMLGRGELSETGVKCVAELDIVDEMTRALEARGQILSEQTLD